MQEVEVGVAGMVAASQASNFSADDSPSDRRAQIARGDRGNAQAVAGLAAGGVGVIVGIALLASGAKKRRGSTSTAVVPFVRRGLAGVHVAGRF
ncbi:MAG: hypothetical protein AAF721_21445 [Myxococcota bacterium]